MSLERQAIEQAVKSTPTLDHAADKLGASRRTLQNHMRALGMPRGKAGRPRHDLPFRSGPHISGTTDLFLLGGVGAALYFAHRWLNRGATVAGSEHVDTYLRGINAVL